MYLVVQFWDKILEWICTTILLLKLGKGPGKPFILVQFWAKERKGYERIYPIPTGKEQFCGQKYFLKFSFGERIQGTIPPSKTHKKTLQNNSFTHSRPEKNRFE